MPATAAPAASVTCTEVSSPDDVDTATAASGATPAVPLGGDTVTAAASWTCGGPQGQGLRRSAALALVAAACCVARGVVNRAGAHWRATAAAARLRRSAPRPRR